MNILQYKGWLRINIFNLLGDFDGHWTFYVNEKAKKFFAVKFGGFESLTSYRPIEVLQYVRLTPKQEAFISEKLEQRLEVWRPSLKYTDISDPMWDNIYGDVRKAIESLEKVDPKYLNDWRSNDLHKEIEA